MNSVIKSKYIESPCVTGDESPQEREMLDILRLAQTEREIGNGNGRATTTAFSLSETGHFYKALTGYWVGTESLKLARQCRYRLQSTENMTFDKIRAIWWHRTDLQESLEILEVFDFVYGFLFQHIDSMGLDSFTNWVGDGWLERYEPLDSQRGFFVKNMWLALNPADVLELLHLTSLWGEQTGNHLQPWLKNRRVGHLRMRGFPCLFTQRVSVRDFGETPDEWYSIPDLEMACEFQLRQIFQGCQSDAAVAWAKYRTTLWQTDTRGRFGQTLSTQLLEFITLEIRKHAQSPG